MRAHLALGVSRHHFAGCVSLSVALSAMQYLTKRKGDSRQGTLAGFSIVISVGSLSVMAVMIMTTLDVAPIASACFALNAAICFAAPIIVMNALKRCVLTAFREIGSVCGVVMKRKTLPTPTLVNDVLSVTKIVPPIVVIAT